MRHGGWLAAAAILAGAAAPALDWPQWRGPDRDGLSKEKGLRAEWTEPPAPKWKATLPGAGYSAPVVAGGTVYVTGSSGAKTDRVGALYALDPKDGTLRWQFEYGPEWGRNYELARTTPTIAGGRAYLVSGVGRAVCVDLQARRAAWSVDLFERFQGRNIHWGIAESPLLVGNRLICHPGGPDAAVAALDIATGATLWTSKGLGDASAYCSPALLTLNGRKQIVTQTEKYVAGLDPETGAVLWTFAHRNQYAVHPNTPVALGPDTVAVASGYGYCAECLRIGAAGAERVWQVKQADCHFHGMLLIDGRLYLAGSGGPLLCLDPADGRVLGRVAGVGRASIVGTPAGILAYDEKGRVLLVKPAPDGGRVAGTLPVDFGSREHWSSPVVADATLYVRHGDVLAAFDLR